MEDVEDDALLLIREFRRGGYEPTWKRVDTPSTMRQALENQEWDIVLSDYSMPNFNAVEALALVQQAGCDVPFLIISAAINEQTAAATMKLGVHDYVMKDNLTRLMPIVDRELREAKTRRDRKCAEIALQESLQASADIVSAIPYGLYLYRYEPPDKLILVSGNPEAERQTGIITEQWIGKDFDSIWPEARAAGLTDAFLNVAKSGEVFEAEDFEYEDERTKGVFRIRVFQMAQSRIGVAFEDVTSRKRVEEDLRRALAESKRRSEEMLALLEGSHGVLKPKSFEDSVRGIFNTCKGILRASGGFVTLLSENDNKSEILLLESSVQLTAGDQSLMIPTGGMRAEVYRKGKIVYRNDLAKNKATTFLTDDLVELCNAMITPLMHRGKPVGSLGFCNKPDGFTEDDARIAEAFAEFASISYLTSRTLQSLENSEERYRDLYENAPIGYLSIAAADGSVLACNEAALELLGYERETLLAMKIWDVYADTPNGRSKAQEVLARLIEGELIRDVELQMEHKEGKTVWVSLSIEPVKDRFGRLVECRSMVLDISERKRLEAQFFQAQKMESIGVLAGGVAHDFNNLLGGILGYTSFMKSKMEIGHQFYKYIDTIEKSATRAAQLTHQLLGFARAGESETYPVDLNKIVEETINILGRTLDKSIEIKTDLFKNLPTVEADFSQLQQILLNLCVNARDAMTGGGELLIETGIEKISEAYAQTHKEAKEGSFATLTVTDTGVGIDKETLEKIFEPFFTTKEEGKGTGLGLAMAYSVVKNHGGFIRVSSEPGRGSTFKIFLPISGRIEVMEQTDTIVPEGGDETILVVDDEEPIRALAKETLESFGYRVLLAENGSEAIRIFKMRKDEIALVILDMVMPKMGGHETFLGMKEMKEEVKALLSTGYSQSGRAQEILDSGVSGFIQKPYKLNDLLHEVRTALDANSY